jgi:cytochrome c-type biogenesis protein CcmH
MMISKLWLPFFFSLMLGLFIFQIGEAQDPAPTPRPVTDDQVNAIAHQMYCPVCENTPLDVCPTQACAEWRDLIREQLSQGWTQQQIKDYFVQRFGDRVLATPPARGLNWLVYVIPPIAFLAGAFLLYRAFLSLRAPVPETQPAGEQEPLAAKDPYEERLEEELRKL